MPPPQIFFNVTSPTGGLPFVDRTFTISGNISFLFIPSNWTRTNRNVQIHRRRSNACQPWVLICHVRVQCSHLGPSQYGGASRGRRQTFGPQHADYLLPRLWKEGGPPDVCLPNGSLLAISRCQVVISRRSGR